MTYTVKEIFYTLQGEGINAGRPAAFLRFAGCNLWSGREVDRNYGHGGCSAWCDTDFVGTDGKGGGRFTSAKELVEAVWAAYDGHSSPRPLVVCTGGEPLLQFDDNLVKAFHDRNFEIAIETNGTKLPPRDLDWICVSPKANSELKLKFGQELKLIFPQKNAEPELFQHLDFEHFLLQPMDGTEREMNTKLAIEYCMQHPQWRLSLQTHKFIGIE